MIHQTWVTDTRPIDELLDRLEQFDDLVAEIGLETFDELYPSLLDELQYYPAPIPGSKYVRTFKLKRGWRIHLQRTGDGFAIVIENAVSYARYVVGSLAQALAAAKAMQARIHQDRWPLASESVTWWYDVFREVFQDKFDARLADFGTVTISRRAVTGRRLPRR